MGSVGADRVAIVLQLQGRDSGKLLAEYVFQVLSSPSPSAGTLSVVAP